MSKPVSEMSREELIRELWVCNGKGEILSEAAYRAYEAHNAAHRAFMDNNQRREAIETKLAEISRQPTTTTTP